MYPFREGCFAVRNGWYVAAFANEVTRSLLARTILNDPVVLYRKESGDAVAVGGRCPHRHFPLGKGCLKGDTIVCGYHGIGFGADGRCVEIPSQDFVPRSYRIPTYPLVEHGAWIFIWMGEPEKADHALLPDLDEIGFNTPGMVVVPMFAEHVSGRYQLLNDNLLDLSHLAFLHGTSIGTVENASTPEQLVKRPGFLSCRREMLDHEAPPAAQALAGFSGRIDRVSGMDFYLPGFHAGIDEIHVAKSHPTRPGETINVSRVYHAVTPETPTSCHYFFANGSVEGTDFERLKDYLRPVIDEDKFATEEIEKMLAVVGESPAELLIKSDRNAVEARRMLQAMMDAEMKQIDREPA